MKIAKGYDMPSKQGPAETFTGAVRLDGFFTAPPPATVTSVIVTFEPGARTAWHKHPAGQVLVVTFGVGWAQTSGEPKEMIRAGDVIWFEPGEKHWHGATDANSMTHVAIQEARDGAPVEWLEHVSDADYLG